MVHHVSLISLKIDPGSKQIELLEKICKKLSVSEDEEEKYIDITVNSIRF